MQKNLIIKLLSGKGSINFNKDIAKIFGIEAAILLGELCYKQDYWQDRDGLTKDGYFYCTQADIEEDTTLSPHKQRQALKALTGIVQTKLMGLPAKRYFYVDEEELAKLFEPETFKALTYRGVDSESDTVNAKELKSLTYCSKVKSSSEDSLPNMLKNLTPSSEDFSQLDVKDFNTTNKTILIKQTNEENTNSSSNEEETVEVAINKDMDIDNSSTIVVNEETRSCETTPSIYNGAPLFGKLTSEDCLESEVSGRSPFDGDLSSLMNYAFNNNISNLDIEAVYNYYKNNNWKTSKGDNINIYETLENLNAHTWRY